jgi:glucose-6-phosphate-specific signal transduction histidine kinase
LSIRVGGRDAAVVHIEIEDDAGGGAVLIPGRGLSELSSELGGSLSIQATQRGTKVVADIELGTGANK